MTVELIPEERMIAWDRVVVAFLFSLKKVAETLVCRDDDDDLPELELPE